MNQERSDLNLIDISFFQKEVCDEVMLLMGPLPKITRGLNKFGDFDSLVLLLKKDLGPQRATKEAEQLITTGEIKPEILAIISRRLREITDVNMQAKAIVKTRDLRKHLCGALHSISNDTFEIAKVVTPVLITLVLSGVITIPLSPLLFASLATIISKMGVSALCADYDIKK
jgi:hypothetical protein